MFKEAYQKKAKPKLMGGLYNYRQPMVARKKGELGIEIEVEATNNLPPRDCIPTVKTVHKTYWVTHNEGSLRNGREYVTSGPIDPSDVEPMINALYQGFADYGTNLSISNRCSTHVHKNVSGKKTNQLTSFFIVWNVFEEALIDFCGISRKTNHFCLSSKDSDYIVQAWLNGIRDGNFDFNEGMKYTALNTRPLFEIGSFEVRCGAAHTTPEPVIEWVHIVNAVADYGLSIEDPREIVFEISGGGAASLFRRIVQGIPGVYEKIVKDPEDFERSCMAGLRRVQSLIYDIRWEDYIEEMRGEFVPRPFDKEDQEVEVRRDLPPLDPFLHEDDEDEDRDHDDYDEDEDRDDWLEEERRRVDEILNMDEILNRAPQPVEGIRLNRAVNIGGVRPVGDRLVENLVLQDGWFRRVDAAQPIPPLNIEDEPLGN